MTHIAETAFDAEEIIVGIESWASIESPTTHTPGVNAVMDLAVADMNDLGADVERLPGLDGYGDVVVARFEGQDGTNQPGILVLSHLDTVHPLGTLDGPLPISRDCDKLFGPGVFDMKGGARIAAHAMRTLLKDGRRPRLPVTFMFTPDEEVGSPSSRERIEAEARNHAYILVPEPLKPGDKVVTGRHPVMRFTVSTHGKPSHAGLHKDHGKSAIHVMARLIDQIEAMTDFERSHTYSVGVIEGGTFVNVVPILCQAQVLCVAPDDEGCEEVTRNLMALEGEDAGVRIAVQPGVVRPVFPPHPGTLALFDRAAQLANEIGIGLDHGQFGGGSDGNFTGALGLSTLDGLGVAGAGGHTHEEHLLISSLVPRCRLLAGLLETLD